MYLSKLLSGRFLFTVATAIVFLYVSFNHIIPAEKIVEIITLVLVFYFTRTDRKEEK